jgi:hypothetical protein
MCPSGNYRTPSRWASRHEIHCEIWKIQTSNFGESLPKAKMAARSFCIDKGIHIFYYGHSKSRNVDTSYWSPENDELNIPVTESSPEIHKKAKKLAPGGGGRSK